MLNEKSFSDILLEKLLTHKIKEVNFSNEVLIINFGELKIIYNKLTDMITVNNKDKITIYNFLEGNIYQINNDKGVRLSYPKEFIKKDKALMELLWDLKSY